MPRLPHISPKDILKALLRADFYIHHQKGSHIHLRHREKIHLRVTIPYHTRFDLPPYIIKSILRQSELPLDEFLELL